MYMDDLVVELKLKGVGCHIINVFLACILYADDVCLIAPSRSAMQDILDICSTYAEDWCIWYNEKKTKIMAFGKKFDSFSCVPLTMNGKNLSFVSEWKYLGVTVKSGRYFSCSAAPCLASFYRTTNTILNVAKKPREQVLMNLLYSICVPILTYACEVKVFSAREMTQLHVACNDAIRKVFTYNRWESVKALHENMGYLSITEIFAERKLKFERKLATMNNAVLRHLHNVFP